MATTMPDFDFTAQNQTHDYHASVSLTWAELEDAGLIDWTKPEWQWDYYSESQRDRLQRKISARYEFREIGILPYAVWRRQFVRKLNEIMPRYSLIYKKVENDFNPWQTSDQYGKSRNVYSDFPATALNGENQDYASNGTDHEHEDLRDGDVLDKIDQLRRGYDDVDVMILDELEPLFSGLLAVNVNGF